MHTMSNSYRTTLPRIIAARNFRRDREGNIILPRVIERVPRLGDLHPLSKSDIASVLPRMPASYLYGLRAVELRPRVLGTGQPFGRYSRAEKVIHLYSLPATEWRLPDTGYSGRMYQRYGASVETKGGFQIVRWSRAEYLACFMYEEVFLHELGHHRDYQYPCRNKIPQSRNLREISANLRAYRLASWRSFERTFGPIDGEPLPGGA